jgi:hypothetical protein
MKKCEVCTYLKQYEDDITINYINGLISKNTPYEQIKEECSKKPIPVGNLFEQHKKKCLKNLASKAINTSTELDSIFCFKNFDEENIESRANNLKKEWFSLCERLTQIVAFNIDKYNPEKTTTSENIKETVSNLKTLSDLAKTDFNFNQLDKEVDTFELLNDEEIIKVNKMQEEAQKRQLELKEK